MLEIGSSPGEMFKLQSSLGEEGWVMEDSLPTGWRKRKTEEGEEEFLSPMMEGCDKYIFFNPDKL